MSTNRQDDTRRAFDAASADFTALGRYLWDPIGEATVAAARLRSGDRVLDACCGAGASAIPAARLAGPDGAVDAVDLSGPMIAELRRLSAGLPGLRAHQADVTAWHTGGYDVVQSALGIFFFPDMAGGTEGLIARVRTGGRAVFTIWRGDAMAAAGRHLNRAIAAVTGNAPKEREPHLIDRINQADSYAAWLSERGLAEVAVTVREMRLTMTPELAWLVITGSGFRGALAGLGPDTVATVRERYLDSLRADDVTTLDASTLIGTGTVVHQLK